MAKLLVTLTVAVLLCGLLAACANAFGAQCVRDPATGKIDCSGSYTPAVVVAPVPATQPGPERG